VTAVRRIGIVGAGVTGLAAAHKLLELRPGWEVFVFDPRNRTGGVLHTVSTGGYLIEAAADNFVTQPGWAVDLSRRIGQPDLLSTSAGDARAFILKGNRLCPVPAGLRLMAPSQWGSLLTTPLLSLKGKLRAALEPLIPRRASREDESLATFACRRLGREALDYLVQPLVAGIYAADPSKLSMRAALPKFAEMEDQFGSLWRGARQEGPAAPGMARPSGPRYGLFAAPAGGMTDWIDGLTSKLAPTIVRLETTVETIRPTEGGWSATLTSRGTAQQENFDGMILCVAAYAVGGLISAICPDAARELSQIEYAGTAVISLGFRTEQFEQPPAGFGFVVPSQEGRRILAGSYSSRKYEGRAPNGCVLIRVFIGGALDPEGVNRAESDLASIAIDELRSIHGIRGEPEVCKVFRWPRTMPQYHVGHLDRVARIEKHLAPFPGLKLAGSAYRGVGVPQCVHSGESAAQRMVDALEP
jgi:oxygen-dependent protoporphyrinogen oxidase